MPADLSPYRIDVRRGSSVADRPAASIIVLVTDDTTMLMRCLRSLEVSLVRGGAHEVIVLANGTPPARVAGLTANEDIVLIRSPINHGFAGGCNLAVRFARAPRLVFLNDDVVVGAGWLEGLHRALDEDGSAAVAGSRVVLDDGRLQEAGSVLWNDGSTSGAGRGGDPHAPEFGTRRCVDYVSFCSAMLRRSAWEEAGGFDERYFPAYYEDLDLCLTLHRSGWKVVYEPSSIVHHSEGASASRHFRDFLSRRNQRIFIIKWASALPDYESPPARESERPAAVGRALRRAAQRVVQVRAAQAAAASALPMCTADALDDVETLVTEVRHLSAAVAVEEEYITALHAEASAQRVLDVLKRRLHPRYAQVKRYLRAARPRSPTARR